MNKQKQICADDSEGASNQSGWHRAMFEQAAQTRNLIMGEVDKLRDAHERLTERINNHIWHLEERMDNIEKHQAFRRGQMAILGAIGGLVGGLTATIGGGFFVWFVVRIFGSLS